MLYFTHYRFSKNPPGIALTTATPTAISSSLLFLKVIPAMTHSPPLIPATALKISVSTYISPNSGAFIRIFIDGGSPHIKMLWEQHGKMLTNISPNSFKRGWSATFCNGNPFNFSTSKEKYSFDLISQVRSPPAISNGSTACSMQLRSITRYGPVGLPDTSSSHPYRRRSLIKRCFSRTSLQCAAQPFSGYPVLIRRVLAVP